MALPSDPAPYAYLAAALAVLVGVAFASVSGWIRVYGPTYAAGVIVPTLLASKAAFLFDDAIKGAAVAEPHVEAAAPERPLIDGEHVLLLLLGVAGYILGAAVVVVFRVYAKIFGRRRAPPRWPARRGRAAGRRATCCGWRALVEIALFLGSVWVCIYCFPDMVRNYMAATTTKRGDAASAP